MRKKTLWIIGALFFILFHTHPGFATTYNVYINANSACGSACDGSTWAKAYRQAPTNLVRDTTYWFASGSYGSHTISTPASGTLQIVYKKATPAEHGPSSDGWTDSMGTGQAQFDALQILTSYFTIDGTTGSGTSGHGFKIRQNGQGILISMPAGYTHDHVVIRKCELSFDRLDVDNGYGGFGIKAQNSDDTKVQYCHVHDTGVPFHWAGNTNQLVEHCYIARNQSTSAWHSEAIAAHYSGKVIVRYSTFEDIEGTAFIASLTDSTDHWEIYGNVFFYSEGSTKAGTGHGIFTTNVPENNIVGLKFYNNTISNVTAGLTARAVLVWGNGTEIYVYNNLWYCDKGSRCKPADHEIDSGSYSIDYNWYSGSIAHPAEVHAQNGGTTNPFVSIPNKDFRLGQATAAGMAISAPYDQDMNGRRRGADGVWDRGAFEFAPASQISAPRNLRIVN